MSEVNKQTQSVIKLSFYLTEKECVSIPASPDWTLEEAVKNAGGKLEDYSFKDHILIAKLNGPVDEAAILPGILCSKLPSNGKIHSRSKKDATPATGTVDGEEGRSDEDPKPQTLFFVKITKPGVTKISSGYYDCKHLGVISYAEDTINDALLNDGRFQEVQDLELRIDDDRHAVVELNYRAADYSEVIFYAKKRPAKKRKRVDPSTPHGESSTGSDNPNEFVVYSNMPETLNRPFSQEFRVGMTKDAKRSALKVFAKAGNENETDKYIDKATKEFGKLASSAIPARTLGKLGQAEKSVGYIECGDIAGTCFLLDPRFIITCFHVINDILFQRSQLTDRESYEEISVHFNYKYPRRKGPPNAVVDESHLQYCIQNPQLDYIILPLKPASEASAQPQLTPLGPLVRSTVPWSGLVILVGHPDKMHKLVEICHIIPGYNWHATLCRRGEEAEHYCEENPEECQLKDWRRSCVHIHKGKYYNAAHLNQLPYDTSFFEGSSGSPVFNADGHIVAMHAQGYSFKKGSTKVSLMEFGITFSAIYQDIANRYRDQQATKLFPEIEL